MDERAIKGVPWTLLTFGSSKIVGLLTTVVLARLLVPADFGLFALAALASLFLTVFRDFGLGSVLIVRQDFDLRARGTVVTMMFGAGVFAALLVAAASPVAALAFDEPRLDEVLAAMSVTLIFGGIAWPYEIIMQRELAFRRRFAAQMIQSVAYAVVALVLAANGAGVWSLVGGVITGQVIASVAYVALAPYRPPVTFDRVVAGEALRSARGFIGQGVLALIRQNTDYLVIGRLLGARPLGLYTMAYRFSELPYTGIADPVGKVLFPTFSKMRAEGGDIGRVYLGAQRLVALVTCPIAIILSAVSEHFVDTILGPKWVDMIPALMILALWGALRPLENTVAILLNAMGQADLIAKVLAFVMIALLPGFALAAHFGGLAAVAGVTLLDMVVTLPVLWSYTRRHVGLSVADQWRSLRPIAFACLPTWPVAWAAGSLLDEFGSAVALVGGAAGGVLTYVGLLALMRPDLLRDARRQLTRMLVRPR